MVTFWFAIWALCTATVHALRYDPEFERYNLNQNKTAVNPVDYYGKWEGHEFNPSPSNWRFPFYTLFLDRFVNGDPTNDNINGTFFEHDINSNQIRHGGDAAGFRDSLDYIQGMGIKGIYLAGTLLMNLPWTADSYSPVDLTVLDAHYGDIQLWREVIQEIHSRGMYVVADNTLATMSDLIGFEGYLNASTPFSLDEHKVRWKSSRHYLDFDLGENEYNETCDYPRFWLETGYPVGTDVTDRMTGCYDGDFDQYGDTEAFGVFPDWQRQLSKFASVQDRLREWVPSVREKIRRHFCLQILMLDIDGFRYDKATQSTVDAMADMSSYYRECARSVGKNNFFIPGEVTGGDTFGAIYVGRGRQPDMYPETQLDAVKMTNASEEKFFIRPVDKGALDAGAFHYSVYRSLTRFLGMDGNLAAGYDVPLNWVDAWNTMLITNDFVNSFTGEFDPRHMYGTTNQDVFRWPAIKNGTERMLLGLFITTLHLPGIPKLTWGEEQAFYVLDSTAPNYIFGRQAMSTATAWQTHGCYMMNSTQYFLMPLEAARNGCNDESQSLDHRDPSHPVRNILKSMYQMRENYPALRDGFYLQQLSNMTHDVFYPGSNETATETGLWSVLRGRFDQVQDLSGVGHGNQSVWLVYQNDNRTVNYEFDCGDNETALISPFDEGTTVKNLFYPHDEKTLKAGPMKLFLEGSEKSNGCLDTLEIGPYEFRAYVPKAEFTGPSPMITKFIPGHDARLLSTVERDGEETIKIEIHFSAEMDCDSVTDSLRLNSTTDNGRVPTVNAGSVQCNNIDTDETQRFIGQIMTSWVWSAELNGVFNGLHRVTVNNASSVGGDSTNAVDHFLFRVGQKENPIVFTRAANYSQSLLHRNGSDDSLYVSHHAAGADSFRYSLNWGSSWSPWLPYEGGNSTLKAQEWSGTDLQKWKGEHVIVEYWNRMGGSSDYVQHGDLDYSGPQRRFPHLFWNGPHNQYGYDAGLENHFEQESKDGLWKYRFMTEWPAIAQVNVWGMNPDGKPDQTMVLGDIDGDSVLDRLPPSSLHHTLINITTHPPRPALAWTIRVNDGTLRFTLTPDGHENSQLVLFIILWIFPIVTAVFGIWTFMKSFYQVKFNQVGTSEKSGIIPLAIRRRLGKKDDPEERMALNPLMKFANKSGLFNSSTPAAAAAAKGEAKRRQVLIATMEYDIEDWAIKIKIGGLGVMAQLMGKNLSHQDLIWVVPCVSGVDYPVDQPAEPMSVTILGNEYEVQVQYHVLRNITYVLLDAPVFRQQTKSEPYPARMDDLDSAIYYSAWNQCIALAIKRFPNIDLYHINDYHGSIAPLYLLPNKTIPACLSLHNAEFQGLWPMRTPKEREEVCLVFNLDVEIATRYVQFGDVFNLLHAGASYLRVHQQGFGAVGVSKKYGKRSYLRYPIFWGLKKVGNLPNPDPSDTAALAVGPPGPGDRSSQVDLEFEAKRADLRRQAQEWAGLEVNPDADLCVFVGRWSMQKGVDLIADVFPGILESHPSVQLICIGPVIDLYGKFAAVKLDKLMKIYPKRVFSKPEFTQLPPYIFSGAEFALIPSRDEPFGLVAVEFGRKGALGIGARVGGLGQMPGWWYTVESTTTSHLLAQFKQAINNALGSPRETRAIMRARSAKQRFPVARWVEDLEILQSTAIRIHNKEAMNHPGGSFAPSGLETPPFGMMTPTDSPRKLSLASNRPSSLNIPTNGSEVIKSSATYSRDISPGDEEIPANLKRKLSLGIRSGPGHGNAAARGRRRRRPDEKPEPDPETIGTALTDIDDDSDEDMIPSYYGEDEYTLTYEEAKAQGRQAPAHNAFMPPPPSSPGSLLTPTHRHSPSAVSTPGTPTTPGTEGFLLPPKPFSENPNRFSNASVLSLDSVVGDRKDFNLQQVDPMFTDSTGEYYRAFEERLNGLDAGNSESTLCIETYLVKSEKKWFSRFRDARLGRHSRPQSAAPSFRNKKHFDSATGSYFDEDRSMTSGDNDEFFLGENYVPPTGLRKWMQLRIGDWPIYSFFLGFGQIIAANSYQITLLTGQVGQTAEKLYVIASIYLVTSVVWWLVFRWFKSVVSLSLPFLFYGMAFFFIGCAHFSDSVSGRGWIQNVGTGFYAAASSSGSIFFALNFGDEGGAPVKDWVFRACVIQGTQQIYVVALWYWGSYLTKQTKDGIIEDTPLANTWKMSAITFPIAVLLWGIGILLLTGLPSYYRQAPGKVPSFYKSLFRRKIVSWFFVTVIIQNFFLSAPYGRNWAFLWSSDHLSTWQVMLLVIIFFIGVWAAILWIFSILSKNHSWILPVFAIGLGAPRFCQILWATSGIGHYIPWMPSYSSGAMISRALWLWLGVLDATQGVGFGMILLQTLTRIHIAFTLLAAQALGSIATIVARAAAPNRIGPGPISPDLSGGWGEFGQAWFWIALFFQLLICAGFFLFFRKEQLSKP